jgi:glutaredoxin
MGATMVENIAIVYSGPNCSWCERVKILLKENDYTVEEIPIALVVEELSEKFDIPIRTVPQVVIDDVLVGGFAEVEAMMRNIKDENK